MSRKKGGRSINSSLDEDASLTRPSTELYSPSYVTSSIVSFGDNSAFKRKLNVSMPSMKGFVGQRDMCVDVTNGKYEIKITVDTADNDNNIVNDMSIEIEERFNLNDNHRPVQDRNLHDRDHNQEEQDLDQVKTEDNPKEKFGNSADSMSEDGWETTSFSTGTSSARRKDEGHDDDYRCGGDKDAGTFLLDF